MRKIAIVRRNGLGDLLCVFPTIAYLKAQDPQTHITLFVDETNAPLLKYLPRVEEVVVFKKNSSKYWQILKTAWKYRKRKFDLAISAKTSPMKLMNLFLFALGAKKRAAYIEKNWSGLLVNDPIYYDEGQARTIHQSLKVLHLVAPHLKEVPKEYCPIIEVPCKEPGPLSIVLTASTTRVSNRLDVTRYAQLVNRLYAEGIRLEANILALPSDHIRARAIASELTVPYHLHFPKSFAEFMQVLAQADLVFCGDGGAGHIGAAMGKKTIVLFGESRPGEWAPLGPHVKTFYDPIHVNRLSDNQIYQALKAFAQVSVAPINC